MLRHRLLIVEDDDSMQEFYLRFFRSRQDEFAFSLAGDAAAAWDELQRDTVDAVVLDWTLPGLSGLDLLKRLRAHPKLRTIPVFMVSASDSVEERVRGIDAGADDYLTKPFDTREFISRLHSLLRRQALDLGPKRQVEARGLTLDPQAGYVAVRGRRVSLHPKELALLSAFLRRPDMVLSSDYLWSTVWGYRSAHARHTLESTLSALRARLGPWGRRIQTRPGSGYLLDLTANAPAK